MLLFCCDGCMNCQLTEAKDGICFQKAIRLFYTSLSEKDRRRYVALESQKLGLGGQTYIASVVGCHRDTVASGMAELQTITEEELVAPRIRRPGGGRKKMTKKDPQLVENFF